MPSVCADIVSLTTAESAKFQSCSSTVSFRISVFLESGPAVLEADLLKRNVSSKVELLQNPAFSAHHGDSNAVAVLVDAKHIFHSSWSWSWLLKQYEKAVATGHQDARSNPTVRQMFLEPSVCAVLLYRQTNPFMVDSYAENRMVSARAFKAEQSLVETHRWLVDCRCNFSSLPSVALRFFDQLAGYTLRPILRVGKVVELRVGSRIRRLDDLETFSGNRLESCVCFMELPLLNTGQSQKVKLKRLLRRYPPDRETSPRLFDLERDVKISRNSSPCLKVEVSLRCLDDSPLRRFKQGLSPSVRS